MAYYLNTYRPLVFTAFGRAAAEKHGIAPFVDGSIRREPDLEHEFPSISCLCRGGSFAPRLRVGDTIGYMTVKRPYQGGEPHWRLTSVLQAALIFPTHQEAALWFEEQGLPLPSNCMVKGNKPKPLSHSIGRGKGDCDPRPICNGWDAGYWARAARWGTFVVCHSLFRNLKWDAPAVREEDFMETLGYLLATRNPGKIDPRAFEALLRKLKVRLHKIA